MFLYGVIILMLLFLLLSALRNFKGTVWNYLLGMNLMSSKIILIIVLFASISNIPYLLDFAIIYALTGFIGTIFIASFLSERHKKGEE